MARNSPVTICVTKQIPNSDPKFHQPLIVDGVGKSTKTSFAILNQGIMEYGRTEPCDTPTVKTITINTQKLS